MPSQIARRVLTRFAALKEVLFVDSRGTPTGPNTPWGKADRVREIMRGVRWVDTPSHGGLGVAKGVADKLLSSAARRLGNYAGGYYWYEEDIAASLAFFEYPEWAKALGFSGTRDSYERDIQRSYPKYFDMLNDGVKAPEKPKPGMKLRFLQSVRYGRRNFSEGDVVTVTKVSSSSLIVVDDKGDLYKMPLGYYYGTGYQSNRYVEAV